MKLDAADKRWMLISRGAGALLALSIVFMVGLFIATKGASGKSVNTAEITINASAETVFDWITDSDLIPQWISGVESSTPLTDGGLEVGRRSREVIASGSSRFELISEITEIDAPTHLTLEIEAQQMSVAITYDLARTDDGTVVQYQSNAQYGPFFVRLLEPFVRASVQSKLEADLEKLKELAEAT